MDTPITQGFVRTDIPKAQHFTQTDVMTVIDATRALTTNGPSGSGQVKHFNAVVAPRDMVAADAHVVSIVPWYGQQIPPTKVKHIRIAHEWGLGRMDVENLRIERVVV